MPLPVLACRAGRYSLTIPDYQWWKSPRRNRVPNRRCTGASTTFRESISSSFPPYSPTRVYLPLIRGKNFDGILIRLVLGYQSKNDLSVVRPDRFLGRRRYHYPQLLHE